MNINAYRKAVKRLVKNYNLTLSRILKDINANVDLNKPRTASVIKNATTQLDKLRAYTKKWGMKNIPGLYKYVQNDTEEWLKKLRQKTTKVSDFSAVNSQAIESLLSAPETGFITATTQAIDSVKNGLQRIHNQAKLLRSQQRLIHETLATTGILEGKSVNEVRAKLTQQLMSKQPISDLGVVKNIDSLPRGHLLREIADMPYVKIPTAAANKGYRRLRLDRYAELTVRTKTRQAITTARVNKLQEVGHSLIQINNRRSTEGDACNLYRGKVFALTRGGGALYGVPRMAELPNGGPPFHVNCQHSIIPFIEARASKAEKQKAMRPPPKWALNKPWGAVDSMYQKKGMSHGKRRARKVSNVGEVKLPETETVKEPGRSSEQKPKLKTGSDKWITLIKEKLEEFDGQVSTVKQAIAVGAIAKRHINQKIGREAKEIKRQLSNSNKELTELTEQINHLTAQYVKRLAEASKSITSKIMSDFRRKRNVLRRSYIDAKEKNSELNEEFGRVQQRIIQEELKKLRSFGGELKFAADTPEDLQKAVEDITEFLPTVWLKAMNDRVLRIKETKGPNAYAYNYEMLMLQSKDPASVLHRLLHRAEWHNPKLSALEFKLFKKRRNGQELQWLGPPYPHTTIGLRKAFPDRYIGRYYEGNDFFEILAVGIPALYGFRGVPKRVRKDSDYMAFCLGALIGV